VISVEMEDGELLFFLQESCGGITGKQVRSKARYPGTGKRFYGIDTYRSCSNLVHTDEARMTSRSVEQKQSTHVRVF
jgi:hypothetical protein